MTPQTIKLENNNFWRKLRHYSTKLLSLKHKQKLVSFMKADNKGNIRKPQTSLSVITFIKFLNTKDLLFQYPRTGRGTKIIDLSWPFWALVFIWMSLLLLVSSGLFQYMRTKRIVSKFVGNATRKESETVLNSWTEPLLSRPDSV